jgi:Anti-sigma factor NepR
MKELKPVKPGWTGREAHQSRFERQTPPRAEAAMQTDIPLRKAGGRLSREDQRRLGDILQRVYDDVIRQGVPDRFRDLLNELDDCIGKGQSAASSHGQGQVDGQVHEQGAGEVNSEPDRLVRTQGLDDNPGDKGSQR